MSAPDPNGDSLGPCWPFGEYLFWKWKREAGRPCLGEAAAGWFSDDSGLPGAHITTSSSKEDASLDGKEEMPSLPENHPATSALGVNPGKNIRDRCQVCHPALERVSLP